MGQTETHLRCLECGVESDELATGWRAYVLEEADEILMFCPRCAEREFGPFGWEDPGEPPSSAAA